MLICLFIYFLSAAIVHEEFLAMHQENVDLSFERPKVKHNTVLKIWPLIPVLNTLFAVMIIALDIKYFFKRLKQ